MATSPNSGLEFSSASKEAASQPAAPSGIDSKSFAFGPALTPGFFLNDDTSSYGYSRYQGNMFGGALEFNYRLTRDRRWWVISALDVGYLQTGVLHLLPSVVGANAAITNTTMYLGGRAGARVFPFNGGWRPFVDLGARVGGLLFANPAIQSNLKIWPGVFAAVGAEFRIGAFTSLDAQVRPSYLFGVGGSGLFVLDVEVAVLFYL